MNLTCEKCGGINSLPKGKTSMFCAFCGTNIEALVKQTKTKVSSTSKGSDKETILAYVKGGSKGILNLPMGDLQGIHLKGANLEGVNLSGANLKNAFLGDCILRKANLTKANLINTNFKGTDLNGADLSGAEFLDEDKSVNFGGANLDNVIIKNTDIGNDYGIDFCDVKSLSGADFRGSIIHADLCSLNLKGINLSGANVTGSFFRSDLTDANLSNIKSGREEDIGASPSSQRKTVSLVESKLYNANLKKAQLINADLSNSDLSYADLTGADLRGSDLSGTILKGAILTGADLRWTKFNGFIKKYRTDPDEYCNPSNLENANLSNTDLRGAILINVDLSKANLKGANMGGAILKINAKKACYLTTACIEAMNLPDDCHELQVLRKFRDGFVSETPEGRELVKEYYEIAPRIVEAVHDTGYENEILTELYSEIKKIVSMIDRKKNSDAFRYYCEITQRLKKQYLH